MRGRLVAKIYEPEEDWVQMMPVVTGKTTAVVPIVHSDDEDWVFLIEDTPKGSQKSRQRRITVSQEVFDRHQEGDWVEVADLGEPRDKEKPAQARNSP
jgi:hypothetical protein